MLVFSVGLLAVILLAYALAPTIPPPKPAKVERVIEFADGTRAKVYDPADLARYEREQRDYYA